MSQTHVAVSAINATDNPGPGVGVARCLCEDPELDVAVVGLAYDALEPGLYMDWIIGRAFTMPYPGGSADEYLNRLSYVQEQTGLDFVIPCLDVELPLFVRLEDRLKGMGIRSLLPTMSQLRMRSKDRLQELSGQMDLQLPETIAVTSEAELYAAVNRIGFPLYVKGIFYEAYRVQTAVEASAQFRKIAAVWGLPVIVQAAVQGDELNVVGVGDGEGGCLGMVGVKKTALSSLGKMWGGVTVRHPAMISAAERLLQVCQWRGPFELECIVNGDDVFLIEINPRFPAWVYFAAAVGVNLPARLIRHIRGEDVDTTSDYEVGQQFLRYSWEMVTTMERFQHVLTQGETN
jgi:carbamoyl-phosphate synthase large subunit